MSTISAAPRSIFSNDSRSTKATNVAKNDRKSKKNTYRDPEMARKYDELLNGSKDTTYKVLNETISPVPEKITINLSRAHDISFNTDNRFSMLQSSSSNDSLNEIVEDETINEHQPETPIESTINGITEQIDRDYDREILRRYKRDRYNAIDAINPKRPTAHFTENRFCEPGDSIYRNYWRYTILKDGTVHCVNAASNRKKITQLVLRIKTAPFEYINDIPVTNYFAMFRNAERLQHISLSGLNLSQITSLGRMFSDCFALKSVDMSNLDLSRVLDYQHMFDNCTSLKTVDFSGCNMAAAVKLDSMFYGCTSIVMVTLSGLTGISVKSMNHMFRSCESLRILELPNLIINDSVEMKKLFCGANKAIDILCPSARILARYLKDKYDESSSSESPSASPSIETLNERLTDSESENIDEKQINANIKPPRQTINEFPHVLTEEQRATAFKWAPPPQSIVPEFIDWRD